MCFRYYFWFWFVVGIARDERFGYFFLFFAEAFSFFLAFLDQFSAGAFHGAVEGDHFLKIFDGFFVEVGVFSGHCSSEEVFGVVFVVLEDLVGEVYAEWPFLHFVVAEGEVGVGWEYDFF